MDKIQEEKRHLLQEKMSYIVTMLDAIDPEKAGVEDIDELIAMLEEIEMKCKEYRQEWNGE
ncbi:MAG: hypothetical protein LRY73_06000 [Bacillus sp. (in: Bacteria)]|nr:hypothetical protein [Bacillus sp. (in: firmicutes)]